MYEGVSLTDNIEKHAGAKLYNPFSTHPHPDYNDKYLLTINHVSKEEPFYQAYVEERDIKKLRHQYETACTHNERQKLKKKYKSAVEQYNEKYANRHYLDNYKVRDLECQCDHKDLYEKILGTHDAEDKIMAYKSCKHTIYGAAKRQMKAAPKPDPAVADDFVEYSKKIIDKEVGQQLDEFGYSYQQWYQHLNRTKQKDMDKVAAYENGNYEYLTDEEILELTRNVYTGICKVELQRKDGKPRMVCGIPKRTKFVMGPICWHLEEIFSKHLQGYCGGKNLDEMAGHVNKYLAEGFTKIVEGDGSAFDNTQDITLKRVDHYIYNRVAPRVYHVPKQEFLNIATAPYKVMELKYPYNKRLRHLMTYSILGSVFSGDCDTTLCNTIRMDLYNRYVNDKAGLTYGVDYICFSKGDDFTVMYKPYVQDDFIRKAYYKYFLPSADDPSNNSFPVFGLGQVLKMLDFGDASSLKFCSLRAWFKSPAEDTIILTRDPSKFFDLQLYSRKSKSMNNARLVVYLLEQATALRSSYEGIHIFDTMAQAYEEKAREIQQKHNISQKHIAKIIQTTMIQTKAKMIRDKDIPRNEYSLEMPMETPMYTFINDVKRRETFYKIGENYWETMKLIERIRGEKLSTEELQYINEQVDAEFSSEYLRALVGINKYE